MAYKLTIQIDYNIYKATRFSIKDVHSYNYLKNSISDDSTFSIQKCVEDKSQLKFLRTELLVEWLIILLILTTACFFTEYDLIYFLIFDCILGVIGLIISTYNFLSFLNDNIRYYKKMEADLLNTNNLLEFIEIRKEKFLFSADELERLR